MKERPTFIQNARLGRTIFQINGEYLEIDSHLFGDRNEWKVLLNSIDPDFEVGHVRMHIPLILFFGLTLGCLISAAFCFNSERIPGMFLAISIYGAGISFWLACVFWEKLEILSFQNHWEKTEFQIIRESKQQAECDVFVAALIKAIENPESLHDLNEAQSEPESKPSFIAYSAGEVKKLSWRWQGAIHSGSLRSSLRRFINSIRMHGFSCCWYAAIQPGSHSARCRIWRKNPSDISVSLELCWRYLRCLAPEKYDHLQKRDSG